MQSLILVSNRGPATFERRGRRPRTITRGGGGLVSALTGLIEHQPALWVSAVRPPRSWLIAALSASAFSPAAANALPAAVVVDRVRASSIRSTVT